MPCNAMRRCADNEGVAMAELKKGLGFFQLLALGVA